MTSMHPHWHSTEDEHDVPVRVAKRDAPAATAPVRVSRAPAAVVGILLMLGVVAYSFGAGEFIGQLTNPTPDLTIRVTADGFEPTPAAVAPGQVIRWVNDDQIPHVLSSQTLPTADGKPFNSPGIFPNGDFFYTVPANAPDGQHSYVSGTAPDLAGEIVIAAAVAGPLPGTSSTASSASSVPTVSASSVPTLPASSASSFPVGGQGMGGQGGIGGQGGTSSVASTTLPAGVIAVNPYVVGRQTGSTGSRKPAVTQHKPTGNAESGPAVWIVLACAGVALVAVTKGAFRRV